MEGGITAKLPCIIGSIISIPDTTSTALKCYIESTGDKEYESNMKKGLEFYKENFFEENGRPKYYHNRAYPIDSQCAAQAIDTLANFSDIR